MWRFHGTTLNLKYGTSACQMKSRLVSCISQKEHVMLECFFVFQVTTISACCLMKEGPPKLLKRKLIISFFDSTTAWEFYSFFLCKPSPLFSLSLSLSPLPSVLSFLMTFTIGSCCLQSPTWRRCVSRPWPLSMGSAMKRLAPSMTPSSLLEKWHWYAKSCAYGIWVVACYVLVSIDGPNQVILWSL